MNYPDVVGEFDTMKLCCTGINLARLGDGDFKVAAGKGYSREPGNERIAQELRELILRPHPRCMVGIPTMDPAGPKYENWTRHANRIHRMTDPARIYHSAFVTRPDSAPWIATPAYGVLVRKLFRGKTAVVICEPGGSMLDAVSSVAGSALHIECPTHEAYAEIDYLERLVVEEQPEIAVLSCGPTATCLANRLAGHGIHAVDLGSAGKFFLRVMG